jgi:hypothetical protein
MSPISEAQIRSLIDYFIAHLPTTTPWLAVLALIVSIGSLIISSYVSLLSLKTSRESLKTSQEQLTTVSRNHIRSEWNGLMDACIKDGNFIDAAFTYNYSAAGTAHNDRVRYEAFCYRAWSLVDFIVRRGLENEKLYDAIISWIVAFHRTWLERNPFMFASGDFWRVYDEVRSKPLMVFQSYRLPHRADAIEDRTDAVDWDKVSEDYHNLVLGPGTLT